VYEGISILLAVLLVVGIVFVGGSLALTAIHNTEAEAERARAEADRAEAEVVRARGEAEAVVVRAQGKASVDQAQATAITSAAMLPWAVAMAALCGWPSVLYLLLRLLPVPVAVRETEGLDTDIFELWQAVRELTRRMGGAGGQPYDYRK
jgi:uncharacterized protein YqfA (UPF0365 family)